MKISHRDVIAAGEQFTMHVTTKVRRILCIVRKLKATTTANLHFRRADIIQARTMAAIEGMRVAEPPRVISRLCNGTLHLLDTHKYSLHLHHDLVDQMDVAVGALYVGSHNPRTDPAVAYEVDSF